jgi:hypothetical protein
MPAEMFSGAFSCDVPEESCGGIYRHEYAYHIAALHLTLFTFSVKTALIV